MHQCRCPFVIYFTRLFVLTVVAVLMVVLLLAAIVRQGFIYLVLLLTPIESSLRLFLAYHFCFV